jgi:hypothetical protein
VKANVNELIDNVSPLITDLLAVNATDHKKVPAVDASQRLMWLIVSVAVIDHVEAIDVIAMDPAEAALNVGETRVVTAEAAVVPEAPGSAVCKATYNTPAVNVVPVRPIVLSNLLAVFAAERPTVISFPHSQ